uniref:Putative inositol phospholipid synthesis protein scs3p n=1 Tax=Ornithodoros turicata TaxID=34597 RepID=A0A2R5LKW7_9ACAR
MVGLYVCRSVVLIEPEVKVPVYLGILLFGSVVCDFLPLPRTYFSRKENIFNAYFVKLGWGWTLVVVGLFVYLSARVYCCGDRNLVKRHMFRLAIGTAVWFISINSFLLLEFYTGRCTSDKYGSRSACIKSGYRWLGFDISGHSFLLIYCNLLIMEEAKSLRGWEKIGEMIRNEKFDEDSPLKEIPEEKLVVLREEYSKLTPYIRYLFVGMTFLSILWDVMLVCTVIYFHTMVQKVSGGIIAVLLWFVTYRLLYTLPWSPGLPGKGLVKYNDVGARKWGTQRSNHLQAWRVNRS